MGKVRYTSVAPETDMNEDGKLIAVTAWDAEEHQKPGLKAFANEEAYNAFLSTLPDAPEPVARPEYVSVAPAGEVEDGLLISIPQEYNPSEHLKPRRKSFKDEADFYDFNANMLQADSESLAEQAGEFRKKAAFYRENGDPEQRKKLATFEKLVAQLGGLREELQGMGKEVDLEALLKQE